jgi:hypothetical protein
LNFEILRRDFRVLFGGKEEIYKIENQKKQGFFRHKKQSKKSRRTKP